MVTEIDEPRPMRKCFFKIELEFVPRNGFVIESEKSWTAELSLNCSVTEIQGEVERMVRTLGGKVWTLVHFQRF